MAIDTAAKRMAMLCHATGLSVRAALPAPAGGLTVLERGAVLQLFTDTLDAPSAPAAAPHPGWFSRVGSLGNWS